MKSFKGALVLAGAFAAFGLGCANQRATPRSQTEVTTPPPATRAPVDRPVGAPEHGEPGTESGIGGGGQDTGGLIHSTPSTTTPSQPSTGVPRQDEEGIVPSGPAEGTTGAAGTEAGATPAPRPRGEPLGTTTTPDTGAVSPDDPSMNLPDTTTEPGVGGSGQDPRDPKDMNPEACIRNEIGSPGSPGMICPEEGVGTGGSGTFEQGTGTTHDVHGGTISSGTSSGTVSSDVGMVGSSALEQENKALREEIKRLKKENEELRSGIGGSGVHEHEKKKMDRKIKDPSGTGGSGLHEELEQGDVTDTDKDEIPVP